MSAPCTETIAVGFTKHERALLEGFADLRGMTASELVRELMGFAPGHIVRGGEPACSPKPEQRSQAATCLRLGSS